MLVMITIQKLRPAEPGPHDRNSPDVCRAKVQFGAIWMKRQKMRLWSLHPSLLDARGLVAVWREALLAQKVLRGKTRGYRHHPQLQRFRLTRSPAGAIASYLWEIHAEAERRGYSFDGSRILGKRQAARMAVTRGQIAFEWEHLKRKVRLRDPAWFAELRGRRQVKAHPLFRVIPGRIASWERGETSHPRHERNESETRTAPVVD